MTNIFTRFISRVEAYLRLAKIKAEQECNANEVARQLRILNAELISVYSSLSTKYRRISDFCYDYPGYIKQLKETESYKMWRDDVIDWARDNVYRLESFYFNDGFFFYVQDVSTEGGILVDLNEKCHYPQDPGSDVICDMEFKNIRLSKDYFEFPGLVWEDEDNDDFVTKGEDDDNETSGGAAVWMCMQDSGSDCDGGSDCPS